MALAKRKDPRAAALFSAYALDMATLLHDVVVVFCPEIVLFSGGFASSLPLFLPQTRSILGVLLKERRSPVDLFPHLQIAQLGTNAGVIGAARLALESP